MSQNVFYEEEGAFKVGTVLADNNTSLQVEAPHGKRSKVKASAVLFRFEAPSIGGFMDAAQREAEKIDVDFLWQCCGEAEFSYEALAQEYYGRAPEPVEAAGVLLRLHGAPMYFYKKGRGRYRAAPEEALKAANIPYQAFTYPGTQHGFHNDTTPRYDAEAAKLAWSRTVEHFKKHLA